ncbi:hypothetical protein os1_33430 [Comamonadaceae bacterium OS-1]|nr:hypothetical protein os1_33430 [Comamonadaceae bacterium OS-1]
MHTKLKLALSSAAIAALSACGGDGDTVAVAPAPATTNVALTVMDGLIQGAVVCLDVNANGVCDTAEPQATTNAAGQASFAVLNTDLGKYPVIAVVPVGAVDADSGPVTTAYTLTAPADQTAVISPLTTLVQQVVSSTGVGTAAAASVVQNQAGLSTSPMANYVASGDSTAATTARVLVVAIQSQASSLATLAGQADSNGTVMTAADIQKAIMGNLGNLLAAAVAAGSDTAVATACADKTSAACKTAIAAAVSTLVADNGLTPATLASSVAFVKLPTEAPATTATTPVASFSLDWVNVGDPNNWYTRIITSTAAEATPDANGLTRYRSIRHINVNGVETQWVINNDPLRKDDVHWNGSAWVNCPVGTQNTSTVRDSQGRGSYNFCDNYSKGTTQRVTTDISGKTLASIFALIQSTRTNGSNWGKAPTWFTGTVTADVGSAVFPTGSKLQSQSDTTTATSIAYDVRSSNIVTVADADVAAGGDATVNSAIACAGSTSSNASNAVTLEVMIARNPGTPCTFAAGSLTGAGGTVYHSLLPNTGWGNTTTSLGTVRDYPLGTSSTATGYYTGNTKLRVAFAGGASNAVTFYACLERSINGSTRNCTAVGTGAYAISTLGDARIMTLSGFPSQAAGLSYERVFVERGGQVYWGFKDKLNTAQVVRLNGTAGNAVFTQLGIPTFTP